MTSSRLASRATAAAAGIAAGLLALGLAELFAIFTVHTPGPVTAVGNRIVRHSPLGFVEGGIRLFGRNDKRALIIGIIVIVMIASAFLGIASRQHARIGGAFYGAFGLIAVAAIVPERDSWPALSAIEIAPALVTGYYSMIVLQRHGSKDIAHGNGSAETTPPTPGLTTRRQFIRLASSIAVFGGVSLAVGRTIKQRSTASIARAAVRLPRAIRRAASPTSGMILDEPGITPLVSANTDFYRIDTALIVPQVDPATWRLKITGLVDHAFELTYDQLLAMNLVEEYVTLTCVSNEVGGDLAGNSKWLGVPLADVLTHAGVQASADQIVGRSVDGFTAGFPVSAANDGRVALIAVGMNNEALPIAHGFPARLVVAGLYGYVSATKWLNEIQLTTFNDFKGYWIPRGWSAEGPIKTQSRIDVPRSGQQISAGPAVVAGVAWAQSRGIDKVEVGIDGKWQEAELGEPLSKNTWRQWRYRFEASAGAHRISVRATDTTGSTQPIKEAPPNPNGADGWHTIEVEAL